MKTLVLSEPNAMPLDQYLAKMATWEKLLKINGGRITVRPEFRQQTPILTTKQIAYFSKLFKPIGNSVQSQNLIRSVIDFVSQFPRLRGILVKSHEKVPVEPRWEYKKIII
ncbi:MAG: hypothetical protein QXQ46_04405 [Thermoplasmatales archaeon]